MQEPPKLVKIEKQQWRDDSHCNNEHKSAMGRLATGSPFTDPSEMELRKTTIIVI